MGIWLKIKDFFFKLKWTSRLKVIIFSLFGLSVLILLIEGGYFLYTNIREKRETYPEGIKPSSIFGEDLAIDPYFKIGDREVIDSGIGPREISFLMGVREFPDGHIGINGYFIRKTGNTLALNVKEKEIAIKYNTETIWSKITSGFLALPLEERELEEISAEDVFLDDQVDAVCVKSGRDLMAEYILILKK
jgi:hypothetical protein